jgi:hypothetical protein
MEDRRQSKQDAKIWKASEMLAKSKGNEDMAGVIFHMEKASPGFLAKANEYFSPNDWDTMKANFDQHTADLETQRANQSVEAMNAANESRQPPPVAQTGGSQNGAQGSQSAIRSTNINPLVLPDRQQQTMQPTANMMPPQAFPQIQPVNVQQQGQSQPLQQSQQQPVDEDRFIRTPRGEHIVRNPELAKTYEEKVAYNNYMFPRAVAEKKNAQARAEENLKAQRDRAEVAKETLKFKKTQAEEKKVEPFRKSVNDLRDKVLKEKTSLDLAESAVKTGETSGIMQFVANKYNLDPMKTPSSVLLNTAAKEFLTGGVKSLGSKGMNQFIEQRMLGMFPAVGQSQEANLSVIEAIRSQIDLDNKKIELYDQLEDAYKDNPTKMEKEVYKQLNEYADKRKNELSYKLSQIKDDYVSDNELSSLKKPTPGTYITPKRAQALVKRANGDAKKAQEIAKQLGYKFPGEE